MKRPRLPLNRLFMLIAILVALSALAGWLWACGKFGYLPFIAIALAVTVWKIAGIYSSFITNLDFIFNAVKNNDYSFRFVDSGHTGNAQLNYSLNRIKDVLDETKKKTADSERYFETIIECANIGIIIVMDNGAVIKSNNKALNLLGVEMLSHVDRLHPLSDELAATMRTIGHYEQRKVRFTTETGDVDLLLNCSCILHNGRNSRVITIENINRELDTQEKVAWEKLTRILTHEIMNSLAPVTSISNTLMHSGCEPEKMQQGLETIHSTSNRLLSFVDSFRSVTRIAPPHKAPFYLTELINEAVSLVSPGNLELTVSVEPGNIMLYADRGQISQVLVNLLKNAVEACSQFNGKRSIEICSYITGDEMVHIEVSNSGETIPAEVAENIFVPFFTTKRDGSGIGLAVSKQIMRLHGGSLYLARNSGGKVTFAVVLE